MSFMCLLCSIYALKITCFNALVSKYFVIYTLTIAKKGLYTLSSEPHSHPLTWYARKHRKGTRKTPASLAIGKVKKNKQTNKQKPGTSTQSVKYSFFLSVCVIQLTCSGVFGFPCFNTCCFSRGVQKPG